MKTTVLSLLTAALLETAMVAGGRLFDAADFVAILFTTGLVAWTVAQYRVPPRTLVEARGIYLPISPNRAPVARRSAAAPRAA